MRIDCLFKRNERITDTGLQNEWFTVEAGTLAAGADPVRECVSRSKKGRS